MEYVLIWELLQLLWRQRQLGMIGCPSAHKRPGPSGFLRAWQYKCNIKTKIYTFPRIHWLLIILHAEHRIAPYRENISLLFHHWLIWMTWQQEVSIYFTQLRFFSFNQSVKKKKREKENMANLIRSNIALQLIGSLQFCLSFSICSLSLLQQPAALPVSPSLWACMCSRAAQYILNLSSSACTIYLSERTTWTAVNYIQCTIPSRLA